MSTSSTPQEVGLRLRAFREMRGLSLRALGTKAGVSPSLLSQIENGKTNASIGSLRRVTSSLGMSLGDLFNDPSSAARHLLRRADRPEIPMQEGTRKFAVTRPPLHHLEVYAAEFEPGASTGEDPYTHGDSQEILIVISGQVTVFLADDEYTLEHGDSIEHRSSVPHRVVNKGDRTAEILWITSPPTPDEVPVSPTPPSEGDRHDT